RGSLGLDLAAAVDITLINNKPVKVLTGIKGPVMYQGTPCGALLLGRSSAGLKGLFDMPGVIDADYTGEICTVVMTWSPPVVIPKGSRIAQLVPTKQLPDSAKNTVQRQRGDAGFGSAGGLALLCIPMDERPKSPIVLGARHDQCHLIALLDTGVDITIID
ncbi:POK9 protein, partial [Horornis vulcanius]|nr:POK9 protein [Horornis vulcanius]